MSANSLRFSRIRQTGPSQEEEEQPSALEQISTLSTQFMEVYTELAARDGWGGIGPISFGREVDRLMSGSKSCTTQAEDVVRAAEYPLNVVHGKQIAAKRRASEEVQLNGSSEGAVAEVNKREHSGEDGEDDKSKKRLRKTDSTFE